MDTRVISIADRYPEFIEYQYESVKNNIGKKTKYTVFNNAADNNIREKIDKVCESLGVESYMVYGDYTKNSSPIHADAMNAIWRYYLNTKKEGILWIDGDMFFINPIDIETLLEKYDLGYCPVYRKENTIECMWTGVLFFNLYTIQRNIDFSLTVIDNIQTDTAGMTYWYLKQYPLYRKVYFRTLTLYDFDENNISTELNGCTEKRLYIENGKPNEIISGRVFPNEKNRKKYTEYYYKEFEEHKEIVNKYGFTKPYSFDLIKKEGDKKSFLYHYKSASWHERYGYGKSQHFNEKNIATERLLGIRK